MSNQKINLNARNRDLNLNLGQLRKAGSLPAVMYGRGYPTTHLALNYKEFTSVYESAGESSLIYLNIDGEISPVIISETQLDPIVGSFSHADFYRVRLDEKITASVPLVFIGESFAEKDLGGILIKNMNEIEVSALPASLPHEIQVDISIIKNFETDVMVKDIKLPDDVELVSDGGNVVATVKPPRTEAELSALDSESTVGVEDVEVGEKKETNEDDIESSDEPDQGSGENK